MCAHVCAHACMPMPGCLDVFVPMGLFCVYLNVLLFVCPCVCLTVCLYSCVCLCVSWGLYMMYVPVCPGMCRSWFCLSPSGFLDVSACGSLYVDIVYVCFYLSVTVCASVHLCMSPSTLVLVVNVGESACLLPFPAPSSCTRTFLQTQALFSLCPQTHSSLSIPTSHSFAHFSSLACRTMPSQFIPIKTYPVLDC